MKARLPPPSKLLALAAALAWATPFAWMLAASFRPGYPDDIASLVPNPPLGFDNYRDAWASGHFVGIR